MCRIAKQRHTMGAGTIYRLKEQKLVKTIKIVKFKIKLYAICIFRKMYMRCTLYNGVWGKAPEA